MWGATEWASARLKLYTPPFAAQNSCEYSPFIPPVSTWSHDMFKMTPPPGCSRISSTAVHATEPCARVGAELHHVLLAAHIDRPYVRPPAERADRGRHFLSLAPAGAVGEPHVGAGRGTIKGDGASDAPRRARHEHHFPREHRLVHLSF